MVRILRIGLKSCGTTFGTRGGVSFTGFQWVEKPGVYHPLDSLRKSMWSPKYILELRVPEGQYCQLLSL